MTRFGAVNKKKKLQVFGIQAVDLLSDWRYCFEKMLCGAVFGASLVK
jgi:hypothetical protein